jgi:TPP-dependent pyruvate/acetoin dehydrogenase alpha subunit
MPTKVRARSTAAAVAGKNGHSLISDKTFRQLYATLLKYSLLEERLHSGCADDSEGAHSQIAGAAGVTLNLEREDTVVLTPHSSLTRLVKGVPLPAMVNHQHANGNACGATFSSFAVSVLTPASPTLSAQLGFATGAALANKLAENRKIAVVFVEGNAAALEACKEALELASTHKLPILYVIGTGINERPRDHFHEDKFRDIGELFPVIAVDAHDVVAVYRVAHESIARVRDGGGPALIACTTYLLNGTPLNAVTQMERYLTGKELFSDRWKREVIAEFNREVDGACLSPMHFSDYQSS